MNEKCSLDNLSRYLRVIGLLSLIIILIIVVYYYLQSNRSKILEKYESYALRDCKVYFTEGDTNIKNCDITQETSNYTGTCSYRFDGWNEFDTYTDNDGKTITYPKKVYTQTRTNTNDFNNPMFTNNCFKAYTDETCLSNTPNDNCIPPEFEYNANNVVRYDEPGTSGNTAVGTNIYGGLRYSSMQFLNTADARYNNTNLISSICDVAPNDALGSLKDKVFYMFEFNGTTNKLENIRSVALDSNQTTFSPVSSDNVLTNLPPRPTDASFYGIQYDATNRNLPIKIFKKNNIPRNVAVFKFNYMSYICTNSQIKNYMRANRIIIPEKFIKYGSSTTPNYSKNISISNNMTIKKDWKWSNYSSADFNVDYSDMLKTDLNTSIEEREIEIDRFYDKDVATAALNYRTAVNNYNDANSNSSNFSTDYSNFNNKMDLTTKSLIGMQKENSDTKMFDYKTGYNITNVSTFSLPTGAVLNNINNSIDKYMIFTNTGANQTSYTINVPRNYSAEILVVGGGGGGGSGHGGGGGAGALIYDTRVLVNGQYTILVGGGGRATARGTAPTTGFDTAINYNGSAIYLAKGGGGGGPPPGAGGNGGSGGGGNGSPYSNTITYIGGKAVTGNIPSGTYGNSGGNGAYLSAVSDKSWTGGGGGGAGGTGSNAYTNGSLAYAGAGGVGKEYNLTGTSTFYAGGGGGGAIANGGWEGAGGQGGGGRGSTHTTGTAGTPNTGGGGGGAGFHNADFAGGAGGSGVVIIRFKVRDSFNNYSFGALTDNTSSSDALLNTSITLRNSTIQANILSSFIFLQRGDYKINASIEGQNSNNILYSELIIYETINNNNIEVYKYGSNKSPYKINILDGKFYKLAFRYIYCNFTNSDILNLSFKIFCDEQKKDLTNYIFGGANIYKDYANSNIMSLFTNVKYSGNRNANYTTITTSIINYLNDKDFFNIKKFYDDVLEKERYKNIVLPQMIRDTKKNDASIINIQSIIGYINRLKGTNANVNYASHLPTTSPSIYKDITIDEIFGKNFDRLITKDKVKDYNALFNANLNTRAPPTKKIYVEAVAA